MVSIFTKVTNDWEWGGEKNVETLQVVWLPSFPYGEDRLKANN